MKHMKRFLSMLLVVAMVFSMAACSRNPEVQEKPDEQIIGTKPTEGNKPTEDTKPTEPATQPTEPTENDRESLEEIVDILDKDDEVTSEDLENMEDGELGDLIVDILENITENPGDTTVEIEVDEDAYDENGAMTEPFDQVYPELIENGLVAYDDETLLIKMRNSRNGKITAEMAAAGIAALEVIVPMEETSWYEAKLVDGTDATVALEALRELSYILVAEYNYAVETAQIDHYKPFPDDKDFGHNEHHKDQWHLHQSDIAKAILYA